MNSPPSCDKLPGPAKGNLKKAFYDQHEQTKSGPHSPQPRVQFGLERSVGGTPVAR